MVRFGGEIGIKGRWTRRTYERLLVRNLKAALRHGSVSFDRIIHARGRICIKTVNVDDAASCAIRVFGVSSVSPAVETSSEIADITRVACEAAQGLLSEGSSFAVDCRRVGTHPYTSVDVCREVGRQILSESGKKGIKVNLENPQFTIGVEVRNESAFVFSETLRGTDGFPLGSQSKAVCLLSGGIDSPVACWLMMKRGCPILPVYFDIEPFTDETALAKTLDVARRLFEWSIGFSRKVYIVPHGENLQIITRKAPKRLTCLLCKRLMYRISARIADTEEAEGIVTGEAIGEQASQTLSNLRVLSEAVEGFPVHRPLLGFNKLEIERLARKIGTFEITARRGLGCRSAPKRPATRGRLDNVKRAEGQLDIEEMIRESICATRAVVV